MLSADVERALNDGAPVVALESTIISHGLPWPHNLQCAQGLEATIRSTGATPATIGIVDGRIRVGLDSAELERFARGAGIAKVSRRDLASIVATKRDGATTVAATMICAALAGIEVFATGGIGGVHRGAEVSMDISADLTELARTSVTVVCAGAKSILDLPRTLEVLETYGVPVLGYRTDEFPAFYLRSSGLPVSQRVDSAKAVAEVVESSRQLGLGGGLVVAVPIPQAHAPVAAEVEQWTRQALHEAETNGISGKAVTPYVLSRVAAFSGGKALHANLALVEHNASVAAEIANALASNHE